VARAPGVRANRVDGTPLSLLPQQSPIHVVARRTREPDRARLTHEDARLLAGPSERASAMRSGSRSTAMRSGSRSTAGRRCQDSRLAAPAGAAGQEPQVFVAVERLPSDLSRAGTRPRTGRSPPGWDHQDPSPRDSPGSAIVNSCTSLADISPATSQEAPACADCVMSAPSAVNVAVRCPDSVGPVDWYAGRTPAST
jgi:hypothetical protein